MIWRLRITPKLMLVFAGFGALLLAGLTALAYVEGREALRAATISDLSSAATEKQAALDDWIGYRVASLRNVAEALPLLVDLADPIFAAESPAASDARPRIVQLLRGWVASPRQFADMLILHPQTGRIMLSATGEQDGRFKEDRLYFKRGRDGLYVQPPYYSMSQQSPAMTIAAPILASDRRLLGVLVGRIDLAGMNAIITRSGSKHATADAFIVNEAGLYVTQPRFITDPATFRLDAQTEIVGRCITGQSGVAPAIDYRDTPVIAAYRWLPERQFCLIVKVDQSEAFAHVDSFTRSLLLAGLAGVVLAILLAVRLARTITRPVLALRSGAAQVAAGQLDHRVPASGHDELGDLARDFNAMAAGLADKEQALASSAAALRSANADLTRANAELQAEIAVRQRAESEVRTLNAELEMRVERRTAELLAANRELEAFSYSVSHDLRAPLRAIDGFSRILLDEHSKDLSERIQHCLRVVRASTIQMGNLIDDLLSFSRVGRQRLRRTAMATEEIVRQVLADLQNAEPGRRLEIEISPLPPCEGDPTLVRLVFQNLLENAFKYTRGRELARIEIGCETPDSAAGSEVVYFVRDNGVGFDMRYADKLFGVFQRLHPQEDYEGTGVGLAIVQRIVQRHGGRVWGEGKVDEGAIFRFTLGDGATADAPPSRLAGTGESARVLASSRGIRA